MPAPIEVFARVAAQMGDRAGIARCRSCCRYHPRGHWLRAWPLTPALLRLDPMFDAAGHDQRFQKLTLEHVASRE